MKIRILYGTETGNAEMLAEDIEAHLAADHEVSCANLSDVAPGDLDPEPFYLVVSSTYGEGELPASAQPFAAALEAARPDLSGLRFAVFGLGDSEYEETFNEGSGKLAQLLAGYGARQLGERQTHDASGPDLPEDLALPWAEAVVALAEETEGVGA